MPNPNTLPSYHYQDIQIPDASLQQQLQQYWATGQYSQALSLLSTNATQLQGKAFIADLINILSSGVLDLETRYNTAVPVFLSSLATQYSTLISNFISQGTWNASVQYTPFNFVVYNSEVYMCISQPPTGTVPTDTTYWLYLGLRGEQGAPGIDVNMRYTWNSANTYNPNDLVVYGTNIYVALVQNTGVTPGSDSNTWGIFIATTPGQINVGTAAPSKYVQNTVWFQTQVDPLTQTTNTPLVGQFYRYNTDISDWEEMYPNVLFRWLDGYENYVPSAVEVNINIQPSYWQNQQFTYSYPTLTDTSFVQIYPASGITAVQYAMYNTLSISVSGTTITLSTSMTTPTSDVPIIIKIQ